MKNILGSSNLRITKWCVALIAGLMTFATTGWGQTTISSDGLNNSTTVFTLSGGLYYTGTTTASDSPASAPYAVEGTHSRGIANGTATLTSGNIDTSGYSSIQMQFRLASYSVSSAANGADGGDIVTVAVSPDGGTTYYSTVRVLGNTNARWSWTSGTGNASTAYDGNASAVDFVPAGGGARTTDGYSTVIITSLPAASNLKIKITLLNNDANERWLVDDFKITGTASSSSPTITLNPASLSGLTTTTGANSSVTNYTVTGTNLGATNVTVTPNSSLIEVSTNASSGFATNALTLTQTGGVVSNTVYVRIANVATATNFSTTIANVSGTASNNLTVSGSVTAAGAPSVTVSPTSATGLTNYVGQVSASTNYTVTGTNLGGTNLVVTASTNAIEVSTNSSTGFTNSFSLAPSVDGTLSNTVYVRISASAPVGAVNATVSNVSGVASNNFTVSGTVTQPALTLVLSPTTVQESAGAGASTGTVGIPFSLTNDLTVSLVSSNTAAATVPSTVTITNGQTNATFAIAAVANTNSYVDATAVIAASQANYISASATLTVGNVDVRVPTVVVNKFENTSVDVIELLVVGNGTPGSTVDMRGMLIKDHSSDNANDSGGKYVFSSDPIWEAVPAGTLVVLTLDDTATDANVDGFVVRVGLKNTTYFTKSGTTNFDLATKDMVMIKQAGSLEAGSVGMIHALANGSPTATQTAGAGSPKLVSNVGNAGVIYASNPNSTIADYNGSSVALGAAGTIPFGTANNPANAAFIASLRGTKDISISIAADASIVNENAEVQADKITVALSVAATTDLTVNLSATPAGIVSLPASVTIPAGSSAATVSFTPINDNTSAGNRTVTIAGSADTWSSANSTVTVVDVQYTNPSVVINEVVNQTSGDVVELLVIQNNLNMAGMILKDFSGDMGGDVGGSYTFTSNSLWQSVKAGTLIALTRDATATEDTDASDGLVTVKLTNTTYFTAGGSFDISAIDMVMIKAAGAESSGITGAIHTFGNGAAGSLFRQANGAKLLFTAGGAGGGADNATSAIVDYNGIGVTGGTATLGAANNANNQTFVTALRASSNSAPTDMALSSTSIAENNAVNAVIGTLSTTDPDSSDTFTYTLVAGTGSTDNASFNINGASLRASAAFDFETKSSYSIRVRTTDSANNTFEEVFSITVTDVVEGSTYNSWLNGLTPSDANAAMLDYAFGATTPGTLDPTLKPSVAIVPPAGGAGGDTATLVLTYYVRQNAVGLTVIPKTSADLAAGPSGWTTVSDDEAVGSPTTRGDGVTVQMRKASVPMIGDRKFLRVEAVQQ